MTLAIDYQALEGDGFRKVENTHPFILWLAPDGQAWAHKSAGMFSLDAIFLHHQWLYTSGVVSIDDDVYGDEREEALLEGQRKMLAEGWIRRMLGIMMGDLAISFDSRVTPTERIDEVIARTGEDNIDGMIYIDDEAEVWDYWDSTKEWEKR